jgi:hypothetical protein
MPTNWAGTRPAPTRGSPFIFFLPAAQGPHFGIDMGYCTCNIPMVAERRVIPDLEPAARIGSMPGESSFIEALKAARFSRLRSCNASNHRRFLPGEARIATETLAVLPRYARKQTRLAVFGKFVVVSTVLKQRTLEVELSARGKNAGILFFTNEPGMLLKVKARHWEYPTMLLKRGTLPL